MRKLRAVRLKDLVHDQEFRRRPSHRGVKPATRFVTGGRDPSAFHGFVNPPVVHASTVLYPTVDDYDARRGRYTYGRRGTPTSEALDRRAGGHRRAANARAWRCCRLGWRLRRWRCNRRCSAGDHVLVTDNVYGPTRKFCDTRAQPQRRHDDLFRSH